MKLEADELIKISGALQEWYKANARELPWRCDPTPYHVWVSEIMLQQTKIEAVRAYYERFIHELPTIKALALCPEDKYMKLWEGLGYYSRVRNLHLAACRIEEEYGGIFPTEEKEIRSLNGIGSYTAGAISSIAFQKPVPAVDGNVLRVLMRLSGDDSDVMDPSVKKRVETVLRTLMEEHTDLIQPGIFTQALMELGEVVCIPNHEPDCSRCPWSAFCDANLHGLTGVLPTRKKAKERRIEDRTVLIIKKDGMAAIQKRPSKGLLAGMYEFPNPEGHLSREEALSYAESMGFRPVSIKDLGQAKHVFSHVEWHMTGYEICVKEDGNVLCKEKRILFADINKILDSYAIPTAFSYYINNSLCR